MNILIYYIYIIFSLLFISSNLIHLQRITIITLINTKINYEKKKYERQSNIY